MQTCYNVDILNQEVSDMCNIAGYTGNRTAAPILLEMMKKEEGFAGGYYTGIATIHEGKLHWRKVIGTVKDLLEQTDAASLPGTVGIIHSRSKSGGDVEWGHPFVNPEENLAYVANGSVGWFGNTAYLSEVCAGLAAEGWKFRSANPDLPHYPACAPGKYVHVSEAMCFLIDKFRKQGLSDHEAMEKVFCEYPAEIVGLTMSTAEPDCISAARINMPMMIGTSDDGTYLASTAIAFPDDICYKTIYPLPSNSSAAVYADHAEITPFKAPPAPVTSLLPWAEAVPAVLDLLAAGPVKLGPIIKSIKPFFEGNVIPADHTSYEILRLLQTNGTIEFIKKDDEGVTPDILHQSFYAKLV